MRDSEIQEVAYGEFHPSPADLSPTECKKLGGHEWCAGESVASCRRCGKCVPYVWMRKNRRAAYAMIRSTRLRLGESYADELEDRLYPRVYDVDMQRTIRELCDEC